MIGMYLLLFRIRLSIDDPLIDSVIPAACVFP